ncbi:MAG: hypothetical protein IBJ10_10790 [Phycisphaerales bacterium]|nr:hypothetical protein [Phycisphaerales bacterium]
MPSASDARAAEFWMTLVRADCERALTQPRWTGALVWMASDLEALARDLQLPESTRAEMRTLALEARTLTRRVRRSAGAIAPDIKPDAIPASEPPANSRRANRVAVA